nr:hypothetical protein [uncultured Pedobacter sp.]
MKKILLLAFTASVMLGACKKSDDTSKDETCTKVSSYTDLYEDSQNTESVTWNVTYDSQGRISRIAESGGPSTNYTYTATSIKEEYNESGSVDVTTYTINDKNQIVKKVEGTNDDVTYTYDTQGYLTEMNEGVEKTTFKWQNGNMVEKEQFINDVSQRRISYLYFDDVAPQTYLLAGGYTFNNSELYTFFGKPSKNLLKGTTGGGGGYETAFQYTKNDKGRVSQVIKINQGQSTYYSSLNYSCD